MLGINPLELQVGQAIVGGFLRVTGMMPFAVDHALGKTPAHLILDVLLEAANEQTLDVLRAVIAVVLDGGRVQHVHDAGERLAPTVVRRRGKENQGIRAGGEQLRHAGTHGVRAPASDVVRFINHDDVPPGILKVVPVFAVLLDRVDGDDRLVEIVKRVVVARNPCAHALQPGGIQADERDGEACPQFLLELRHHGFDREHQDAPTATAPDHLGEQDAALNGFAEADGVGDEDALTRLLKRKAGGIELIGQQVHRTAMAKGQPLVRRNALAQERFEEQPGVAVIRGRVVNRRGGFRVNQLDRLIEFLNAINERGFAIAHERGQARDGEQMRAGRREVNPANEPLLVAGDDPAAWREGANHWGWGKDARQCERRALKFCRDA